MKPMSWLWASCLAALLAAACGGGSGTATETGLQSPQAAVVDSASCTDASSAAGTFQVVDGQCLRGSTALNVQPQRAPQAPQATATLTATALMDWAEQAYPQYFAPSAQATQTSAPYVYRFYPGTRNYLGVSGEAVYVLGPISGGLLAYVGSLADFNCRVLPQNCSVPGAPTIGAATAGNASASVAFTAPASTGGSPITRYNAACTSGFAFISTGTATASPIVVSGMTNGSAYLCTVSATNSSGTGSPSAAVSVTPSASSVSTTGTQGGTSTGAVSTASLLCALNASVFNATLNLNATVAMSCSGGQRAMTGNGIPDHAPGTFPNANNPNTISAQSVRFNATTSPAIANTSGTAVDHVVGYANNGIKFDPATAESYQNAGVWKIEALGHTYLNLGLDSSNAHVQPDGAYHYHGVPTGYVALQNKGTGMTLVGFALDGFPIYSRYGYSTATNAASGTRVMTPSWRLKTTPSSGRPATSAVPMGVFTQDYEYVAGLGDLDECNGRTGVTPEFPAGIYHYFITDAYPYIQRCIKGTALQSGSATGTTTVGGTGTLPPPPR